MKISKMIQENISYINEILPVKESFDIIERDMIIGGRESCFFFIDGFMKDEVMSKVMDTLFKLTPEEMPKTATELSRTMISYVEIDTFSEYDEIIKNILSGVSCLFVDGFESCIAIDCRTYPSRSVDEPAQDKSLRGSRDGFVETIVFNTALMRRRIRDPHLTMKMTEIGKSSRTDVALCYMSDRVDQNLLSLLTQKLEAMQEEDLKMNQQSLAELLFKRKWYNPFPKVKYTERPDTAAACLLEGKIILLVDTSPSAMILPTSIFDMIEEANDYYFPTLTGIYLKISRGLITLMTIFLTPLFLLFMQNPQWIPEIFDFVLVRSTVNIPLYFQLLLLELSSELLSSDRALENKTPGKLPDMIEWIRSHYDQPMTVEELAARYHYHPAYLTSLMKKYTGYSVNTYINHVRLAAAKNLLCQGDFLSIASIAHTCGFPDEKYFMRLFKKQEGMTPSQYRAAFQKKYINAK